MSMRGWGVQAAAVARQHPGNAMSNITIAPWIVIAPVAVIIATLFAIYAISDQLREAS